jgi:hypothetical protein
MGTRCQRNASLSHADRIPEAHQLDAFSNLDQHQEYRATIRGKSAKPMEAGGIGYTDVKRPMKPQLGTTKYESWIRRRASDFYNQRISRATITDKTCRPEGRIDERK